MHKIDADSKTHRELAIRTKQQHAGADTDRSSGLFRL
jgi:hypothetical protein